ncbi:MAG: glycosyltransferase family 4 protein [Alphaproteobacteria bacterium]|nr:glycosyltransferase family 4 protein [Alphaproteobacteria bacterium]
MKVGLLVRTLGTNGGTERFVHGFCRWLVSQGHEVVVHCAAVDGAVEGAEVRLLPVRARGRVGRLRALDRAAEAIPPEDQAVLIGFLRGGRPDLYRAGGGSHRAWMARQPRPAWDLAGRRGDAVEAALDDAVLARARRVVANSELCRRDLVEASGVDPDRIVLVRNGVDLERFRPRDLPRLHPGPTVLFLGNGWARKNLPAALRSVVAMPKVQLVVAGHEPRAGRFRALAAELGLGGRVHWHGPAEAPEHLLPTVDALVLPTRYDPCANVCMEALACGVPVVTTALNGAAEVLPDPGLVVADPDDAFALALALERALQTPGLGAACRTAAEALPAEGAFAELLGHACSLLPPGTP